MRWFKRILWAFLAIAVLLMVALVVVLLWFNPNHYKAQISQAIYQKTGRTLAIQGNISWSLFPSFGVSLGKASLSDRHSNKQFARISSADISLQVVPLLSNHLVINQVQLHGLHVYLRQQSKTQNNWSFVSDQPLQVVTETKVAEPTLVTTATPRQKASSVQLRVDNIHIHNANISLFNALTNSTYQLRDVNLSASQVNLGQPFSLHVSFHINSNKPQMDMSVKAQSQVTVTKDLQQITLRNLQLHSQAKVHSAKKVIPLNVTISGTTQADLRQQQLHFAGNLRVNQLKTALELKLIHWQTALHYQGHLTSQAFNLPQLMADLALPLPVAKPQALSPTTVSAMFEGNPKTLGFKQLKLVLGQTKIAGQIHLDSFAAPQIKAQLTANHLALSDFINMRGMRLPIKAPTISVNAQITDVNHWQQTLTGHMQWQAKDLTLYGLDLTTMLKKSGQAAKDLVNGKDIGSSLQALQSELMLFNGQGQTISAQDGKKTVFGHLLAKASFKHGFINNELLQLHGPHLVIHAHGRVKMLAPYDVSYSLNLFNPTQNPDTRMVFPVLITGPIAHLSYRLDSQKLQDQLIRSTQHRVKEKLHHRVQEQAGRLLSRLFG